MIGPHGRFGLCPHRREDVVEALRTFHGAEGFQCVSRTDDRIEFSRHRWLRDRMVIAIHEEEEVDGYIQTKVVLSFALNPLRHPFASSRPSMDVTRVDYAIVEHLTSVLGHVPATSTKRRAG